MKDDAYKVLMPGETIPILDGRVKATVYPMGMRHVKRFTSNIAGLLSIIGDVEFDRGDNVENVGKKIVGALVPHIIGNIGDLVADCVKFDKDIEFDDLPHYELPPIIEVWLMESFGEEKKWRPWLASIENMIHRFSGKRIDIMTLIREKWQTSATVSNFLSRADTDSKTSSNEGKKESRTAAGHSRSSSSG